MTEAGVINHCYLLSVRFNENILWLWTHASVKIYNIQGANFNSFYQLKTATYDQGF